VATNGENLLFLGAGRFPLLYKMDPATGDVLEQYFMWIGSGYYTDATMLGDELYLLDHRRRQVHVMDPFAPRYLRSLSLGSMHGITIGGGIAALSGPNRLLYVADAYQTESIYEIYPATGALTGTLPPLGNRPTALAGLDSQLFVADFRTQTMEVRDRHGTPIDAFPLEAPTGALAAFAARDPFADFDSDGDVDLLDVMAFQNCFKLDGGVTACPLADSNGDKVVDLVDANHLAASTTGP
jgi:hypothetical protein